MLEDYTFSFIATNFFRSHIIRKPRVNLKSLETVLVMLYFEQRKQLTFSSVRALIILLRILLQKVSIVQRG